MALYTLDKAQGSTQWGTQWYTALDYLKNFDTNTVTFTNKTLTNPTINGATISGSFAGDLDVTGGMTGSNLNVSSASTGDLVVIECTNALNQTAPDVVLYRNSASPAALDNLGLISFDGNNSSLARKAYTLMFGSIVDPTAGSEKGQLNIFTLDSGTVTQQMTVKSNGVINFANMPTSAAGLATGDVWSNSGILTIV